MPATALAFAVLIMAIALPVILYQPLRKYAGRYPSYILAGIISICLISGSIYLWKSANNASDIVYAIGFYLPLQLAVLFWGLIWLRVNAFKFADPPGPVTRPPVVSLPSDRIEPALAASTATGPWGAPAATSRLQPSDSAVTQERPADATYDHSPTDDVSRNFFIRYWRGQFSLPFSFWIVGVLGPVVILIAIWLIMVRIASTLDRLVDYNPYGFLAFVLVSWTFLIVWTVWDLVGLWRSATRAMHRRWRQGKHTFWGSLVKLIVINGIIFSVWGGLITVIPQIYEAYNITFNNDPNIENYTLRIMRNGTEMEVTGGFKYGLTKDVERLLKASPQIRVVHLDSTGGRIGEAIDLHDVIRQRQLITYVTNECDSACTIAFAGGKERWLGPAGKLGFRAPSFPGMTPEDLRGSVARQQAIFTSNGFTADFATRALSTPATSLWTPTITELRQGGAVISIAPVNMFAMSGLGAAATPEEAGAGLKHMFPVIEPLATREPDLARVLTQDFYQMYRDGSTLSEFTERFSARVGPTIEKYRSLADDETQLLGVRLKRDEYSYLALSNRPACYEYITKGTPPSLPAELSKRERDLEARIIRTAAPRPPATKAAIDQASADISKLLQAGPWAEEMYLFRTPPRPDQYADFCMLHAALNGAILQLPPEQGAMIAREMLPER